MSLCYQNSLHVVFVCFSSGLFQGSKFASATARLVSFRGHKKLEPQPDGLLQGLNSKFPTSIPVCYIWESPPGPSQRSRFLVLTKRWRGKKIAKIAQVPNFGSGRIRPTCWRTKKRLTLERANGQIKSTGTWWVPISKCNGQLEGTELRKADRTVGVNCNIFSNISSGTA